MKKTVAGTMKARLAPTSARNSAVRSMAAQSCEGSIDMRLECSRLDICSTLWNILAAMTSALGEFEQIVLMAVVRLEADAYGATIRRDIEGRTGRRLSISAVYTTLDRLEEKGLVRSWTGEPTAERGGRRRKHFALLPPGKRALRSAYTAYTEMAAGLERRLKAL